MHDTGYTHFRVMDLLLAAHFVYQIPFSKYPMQADGVSATDGWVKLPGHSRSTYCKNQFLYIDAGSPAWSYLVEVGRLDGLDALAPVKRDLFDLALGICFRAEQKADRRLIAMWYRLLGAHAVQSDVAEVQKLGAVVELRALVKRTSALAIEMEYGCLRTPTDEDRVELPLLDWWFRP